MLHVVPNTLCTPICPLLPKVLVFFMLKLNLQSLFLSLAVCKDPPYKVEESGYAGFILPIEVYFKNKVPSFVQTCNCYYPYKQVSLICYIELNQSKQHCDCAHWVNVIFLSLFTRKNQKKCALTTICSCTWRAIHLSIISAVKSSHSITLLKSSAGSCSRLEGYVANLWEQDGRAIYFFE